jgi:hypothetical protein
MINNKIFKKNKLKKVLIKERRMKKLNKINNNNKKIRVKMEGMGRVMMKMKRWQLRSRINKETHLMKQ